MLFKMTVLPRYLPKCMQPAVPRLYPPSYGELVKRQGPQTAGATYHTRFTLLQHRVLSGPALNRLIAACRANNTTVQGALVSAAFRQSYPLVATEEEKAQATPILMSCDYPVSMRPLTQPPIDPNVIMCAISFHDFLARGVGPARLHAKGVCSFCDGSPVSSVEWNAKSFWDLAHNLKRDYARKLPKQILCRPLVHELRFPDGKIPAFTPDRYDTPLFGRFSTMSVSNTSSYPFPITTTVGGCQLTLTGLEFSTSMQPLSSFVLLCVQTVGDRMCLTISSTGPMVSMEDTEAFADGIMCDLIAAGNCPPATT
jgi:hypothetical protein